MASFTQRRLHAEVIAVEDDLVALVDINRALRDQAISVLLELAILREHMEARAIGRGGGASTED